MTPSDEVMIDRERWSLAALRVSVALLRLELVLRRYDPSQPRAPAGSREGGRWVGGGGDLQAPADVPARFTQLAPGQSRPINLREEETRGGHTIRDHVGKTDEYLLGIVGRDRGSIFYFTYARKSEGSFDSSEGAENFVNRTIDSNQDEISKMLMQSDDFKIEKRFGYKTGREAFRDSGESAPYIRQTYDVRVIIRPDMRRDRGYSVLTAFPTNQRPSSDLKGGLIMYIPDCYYDFAASFYPRLIDEVSNDEAFIRKGLSFITEAQRSDLKAFLTEALAGGCTIAELQREWTNAGPRYGFNDSDLRGFLDLTRRLIPERA